MGTIKEPAELQIPEEWGAPEVFCTDVPKIEKIGTGTLRFWCCLPRGGMWIPQVYVMMPVERVIPVATHCLHYATEVFNTTELRRHLM